MPEAPGEQRGLLATARWPEADPDRVDAPAEELLSRAIAAVTELRRYRDDAGVKPSAVLPARLAADGYDGTAAAVARLARLELRADGGAAAAEVPVPGGAVELLPSADLDAEAAGARLAARRDKLDAEIARLEGKLANERFVERAPAEVVAAEREKLAGYRADRDRLG